MKIFSTQTRVRINKCIALFLACSLFVIAFQATIFHSTLYPQKNSTNEKYVKEIIAYLLFDTAELPSAIWNEKERRHMADVRAIIGNMQIIFYALLVILPLMLYNKNKKEIYKKASIYAITIASVILLMSILGFDTLFVAFHEAMFTNDDWKMDAATDVIIQLFPEETFQRIWMIMLGEVIGVSLIMLLLARKKPDGNVHHHKHKAVRS